MSGAKANTEGAASRRPLRAIGYLRVSSTGQQQHGAGLAAQRQRVLEFAAAEGLELVEILSETASGSVRDGEFSSIEHRPILRELVDRAERREFDVVVVASFDRLSRDQIDAQLLKRWLGRYGVTCLSAAGESNGATGAIAELIDRLLGAIHDFDRKRIIERVNAGKEQKRKQGRHTDGRIPYGYRSGGDGKLELAPDAVIVRQIFEDAKDGHNPSRIARDLNREGVPGPRGGAWSRQGVTVILRNVVYAGERHGVKRVQPAIVSRQLWNTVNRPH